MLHHRPPLALRRPATTDPRPPPSATAAQNITANYRIYRWNGSSWVEVASGEGSTTCTETEAGKAAPGVNTWRSSPVPDVGSTRLAVKLAERYARTTLGALSTTERPWGTSA